MSDGKARWCCAEGGMDLDEAFDPKAIWCLIPRDSNLDTWLRDGRRSALRFSKRNKHVLCSGLSFFLISNLSVLVLIIFSRLKQL